MTSATRDELLTRRTLQVDGSPAGGSIVQMIRALRRVPGVLLADASDGSLRAVVAHDAAVPATSLIAAARNVGVRVSVIGDPRATPAEDASVTVRPLGRRRFFVVAAGALIVLTMFDLLVPNAAREHKILIGLIAVMWGYVLAKSLIGQRRS